MQKDNVMITGDALLDFGDGSKLSVVLNRVGIFITKPARQPSGDIFPGIRLENGVMTWNIKYLPITR